MYELRMATGQLRVAGAFAAGKRTGTFIFWTSSGARRAVIPYDDDIRTGTVALWYVVDGMPSERGHLLEAPYVTGNRHGITRTWYANGRPRGEYAFEHGELVAARAWTDAGNSLDAEIARAEALRDAASDERELDALERIVAEHRPSCG